MKLKSNSNIENQRQKRKSTAKRNHEMEVMLKGCPGKF